jgi:hypothetical protein
MIDHDAETAALLQGQGARFLVSSAFNLPILSANAAFTAVTTFLPDQYTGCGLKVLYSVGTDTSLMEETVMKAMSGVQAACGVYLTGHQILMQVNCFPIQHTHIGSCVLCVANPIPTPTEAEQHRAGAIISTKAPYHIMAVGDEWKELLKYSSDEMLGRSLKLLQGPSTDNECFKDLMDAVRSCRFYETTLSIHRKDGSPCTVCLRLRPIEHPCAPGAIVIQVETELLHTPAPSAGDHQSHLDPSLLALLSSLQLGAAADEPAHRAEPAGLCELAVRPPEWALDHMGSLLEELHRAGLVLHWEWAALGSADSCCCEEGAALLRLLADVAGLRARAAAAARCPTGLLCLWLLAMADDGAAAAWDGRCAAADVATDFGFLVAAER